MPRRPGSLKRIRYLAAGAFLALAILHPLCVAAEEGAPGTGLPKEPSIDNTLSLPKEPAVDNTPSLPKELAVDNIPSLPKGPAVDNIPSLMQSVDEKHAGIERSILDRVIRFDNFFGSVKTESHRQPDYLIRWQNSLRVEEGGRLKYLTNLRAGFTLPKISQRLRLVISGENESEPVAARLPTDPGNPGFDRTLPNTRLVNTELRYGVYRTPSIDLFVGAGVRVKLPMESFARTRFQYTRKLGEANLLRFGETLFWKNTEKFGETTEIELARQLNPRTVLRWSNAGTLAQETEGMEWGSELSLLRELSPKSAITFSGGLFGVTRPAAVVQTYRVLTRYRRNFLRKWLFYELEPEVSWPRDAGGGYKPAYAFTVRLEVVFEGKDVMPPEPPR